MCALPALCTAVWAQAGAPRWPPAPDQARVRFVRSIDPALVRGKPSFFSRVIRVLIGDREEPRMRQPYGVAVSGDGTVYVADTFGRAIHVYDLKKPAYRSISVDGGSLIGVAVAGNRLFVTDSESGRLLALDLKGRVQWTLGPKQGLLRPTGLVAAGDRLYVVDTLGHQVVVVSFTGVIAGRFGSRGSGNGQFNFPTNIACSGDGRLYVTDAMNFRVQIFEQDGRFLRTFGQLGDGSGDFDKPKGIAVDTAGHIYVVEGLNDVVQMFDDAGRLLLVFGGSGTRDGELYLPTGIAVVNDVVYVADSANRRVAIFEHVRTSP
jgi:DNA-binding beta-propeller fold protein YncE